MRCNSCSEVFSYVQSAWCLAIHTWPELGYAAVDLFTCGESCDPKVAYDYLKKVFSSKKGSFSILKRGILSKDMLKVDEKPFELKEQIS